MSRGPWRQWGLKEWLWEVGKQCIDQGLHALWGFGPWYLGCSLIRYLNATVPVPEVPVLLVLLVVMASTFGWIVREIAQYPSTRPWDPILDNSVFIGAWFGGLWTGLAYPLG